MNCKKINTLLLDFIEKNLDAETESQIYQHIQKCEKCEKNHKNIENIFKEINNLKNEKPEVSYFFTDKIISSIKNKENEVFVAWNWINQTLFKKPQVIATTVISVFIGIFLGIIINYNQFNNVIISDNNEELIAEEDFHIAGITNSDIFYFFESNN